MKKIASFFLALSLTMTWQLPAKEISTFATRIVAEQEIDLDNDGYELIACQLRPIKRAGKSLTAEMIHTTNMPSTLRHANMDTSVNWSGYSAMTGKGSHVNPSYGSVTEVSGTWRVPTLTASEEGTTYSSAWVGIDGFSNQTVEQIGTEHDITATGVITNYAWFEMFPAGAQLIDGFPLQPGDKIEGKVTYKGPDSANNDTFRLVLKNHTRGKKFVVTQSTLPGYPAHLSSADWIVEAPAILISDSCFGFLPLSNFGTISFTDCQATINGVTGAIGNKHWTYVAISMLTIDDIVKDITSDLISTCDKGSCSKKKKSKCGKDSFTVVWESSGPFPYDTDCLVN